MQIANCERGTKIVSDWIQDVSNRLFNRHDKALDLGVGGVHIVLSLCVNMWAVQSEGQVMSHLRSPTTHMIRSAELLLPVRSIPPTAEHNATLHRTEPSRGKEKPVRLTGAWKSGMGLGGCEYVA